MILSPPPFYIFPGRLLSLFLYFLINCAHYLGPVCFAHSSFGPVLFLPHSYCILNCSFGIFLIYLPILVLYTSLFLIFNFHILPKPRFCFTNFATSLHIPSFSIPLFALSHHPLSLDHRFPLFSPLNLHFSQCLRSSAILFLFWLLTSILTSR